MITIIVLLILAGVALASLSGENGLLKRSSQAKEEAIKAQLKEEIEMAIMDIQAEELPKGNNVTLESLAGKEEEKGQLENNKDLQEGNITADLEENEITGEYKGYNYKIEGNLKVTIIDEVKGINIRYKLEPEGYTNGNITITINATSTNGNIEKIESLSNNGITKTEQEGVYTVTANGEYEFKVTDSTGNTKNKTINIQKIDKLDPKNVNIEISNIEIGEFTIEVDAEDEEANETSVKSGIGRYEYFVKEKAQTNGEYKSYNSTDNKYVVTELQPGTEYTVYVIAYDKAENSKTSDTISETTYTVPLPPLAKITFNEENATTEALDYPILTLNGMMNCSLEPKEGENVTLEITSPKKQNITYYYSIDGGKEWIEYTNKITTPYKGKDLIQVKSKYKDTVDSDIFIVKKYKKDLTLTCTESDALNNDTFDDSYTTNQSTVRSSEINLRIHPECWGKYISMYCKTTNSDFYGYLALGSNKGEDDKLIGYISKGYSASRPNLSGHANASVLCARSISILEGSNWCKLGTGAPANGRVYFYLYEIWCSEENLTGTVYN